MKISRGNLESDGTDVNQSNFSTLALAILLCWQSITKCCKLFSSLSVIITCIFDVSLMRK